MIVVAPPLVEQCWCWPNNHHWGPRELIAGRHVDTFSLLDTTPRTSQRNIELFGISWPDCWLSHCHSFSVKGRGLSRQEHFWKTFLIKGGQEELMRTTVSSPISASTNHDYVCEGIMKSIQLTFQKLFANFRSVQVLLPLNHGKPWCLPIIFHHSSLGLMKLAKTPWSNGG